MLFDILEFMSSVKMFGVILAIISNSLILSILMVSKCAEFGTYRYLMMIYTIIDMTYSVSYYLSDMSAHSTNTSYVLFRHFHGKNRVLGAMSMMQFCILYILVLCILVVHFVYRYVALCARAKLVMLFTTRKLMIWVSGCLVFGVIVGIWKCYMFYETPYTTENLRTEFEMYYGLSMENIVYNGPAYKLCDSETVCYTPKTTLGVMGSIITFLSICLGSMSFFGYRCFAELRLHETTLSGKTKSLQKQLLNALLIQSIIPIVFMYIPVTLLFLSPAFGIGFGVYGNITMVCLAIYPPVDQFAILFVIRDFRKIIRNKVAAWTDGMTKKDTSSGPVKPISINHVAPA